MLTVSQVYTYVQTHQIAQVVIGGPREENLYQILLVNAPRCNFMHLYSSLFFSAPLFWEVAFAGIKYGTLGIDV